MNNIYKIVRFICFIALGLILSIALITGANILFVWSIFGWLQNTVLHTAGLQEPLARGIAAIIMAIFVTLPLGSLLKAYTPIPQKNKSLYRAAIFVVIAIFSLGTYFASQNTFFDPITGKPIKYYSILPNGDYKFFSNPGYDPVTGVKLLPVTTDEIYKSKGLLQPLAPYASENTFFDPITGKPVKYYTVLPNGVYKFFSSPGYDPVTGVKLLPVTSEVIYKSKGLLPPPAAISPANSQSTSPHITDPASDLKTKQEPAVNKTSNLIDDPESNGSSNSASNTPNPIDQEKPTNKETVSEEKYHPADEHLYDNLPDVTIDNQSDNTLVVLDSYNGEYARVAPWQTGDEKLPSGQYRASFNNGRTGVSFMVTIQKFQKFKFIVKQTTNVYHQPVLITPVLYNGQSGNYTWNPNNQQVYSNRERFSGQPRNYIWNSNNQQAYSKRQTFNGQINYSTRPINNTPVRTNRQMYNNQPHNNPGTRYNPQSRQPVIYNQRRK